jgi:predicted dehydrogenase
VKGLYENVLLGSVIHELSLIRGLGIELPGEFDFVSVDPPLSDPTPDGPPRILAVAPLPNGAQLQLSWNWVPDYPEYTEEVAVFGSAGRIHLAMPGPYLPAHRAYLRVQRLDGEERIDSTSFAGHKTAFVAELEAFARSVLSGESVISDVAGASLDIAALQKLAITAGRREGLHSVGEATSRGPIV